MKNELGENPGPLDDSLRRGARDREAWWAAQAYEVEYFARKHGITTEQARQLIKEHGDRPIVGVKLFGTRP